MFCHKCGNKLPPDAAFCNKCGANVAMIQSSPVIATETKSNEDMLNSSQGASVATSEMPEKSEAVITSYNTVGIAKMKIKVFCNGTHVGTLNKGESITVPIPMDSMLEFKCAFRKASIMVKAGMRTELQLEFNPSSGKLLVLDINSESYAEEQAKLTNSRKNWNKFAYAAILVAALGSIIMFFVRDSITPTNQVSENLPYQQTSDSGGLEEQRRNDHSRIMIGETQMLDDGFDHVEITLEYAEFVDRIDSIWPELMGDYTYPDEGYVF